MLIGGVLAAPVPQAAADEGGLDATVGLQVPDRIQAGQSATVTVRPRVTGTAEGGVRTAVRLSVSHGEVVAVRVLHEGIPGEFVCQQDPGVVMCAGPVADGDLTIEADVRAPLDGTGLSVSAFIDPDDVITESDETNNEAGPQAIEVFRPNLTVAAELPVEVQSSTSVVARLTPRAVDGRALVTLDATVMGGGRLVSVRVVGGSSADPLRCDAQGDGVHCSGELSAELTPPVVELGVLVGEDAGQLEIAASVDGDNRVIESDEGDNSASAVAVVYRPNLSVDLSGPAQVPPGGAFTYVVEPHLDRGVASFELRTILAPNVRVVSVDVIRWGTEDSAECRVAGSDVICAVSRRAGEGHLSVEIHAQAPDLPTDVSARALVDPEGALLESDEGDNSSTVVETEVSDAGDTTPPQISPRVDGPLGSNGWYVGDVNVDWAVDDAESRVLSSEGCSPASVSQDTVLMALRCTATSTGGRATQVVSVMRDTVRPALALAIAPSAPDGEEGWYVSSPHVAATCSDATSGIASCTVGGHETASLDVVESATTQDVGATAVDMAGLTTRSAATGLAVDLSPPVVTCVSPAPAFHLGSTDAVVRAAVTDAASGPRTNEAAAPVPTGRLGSYTVALEAADHAGHHTSVTCPYRIVASRWVSVFDATAAKGDSGRSGMSFAIALTSAPAPGEVVSVVVRTADRTARDGDDYVKVDGQTLRWEPGDPLVRHLSVSLLGDRLGEGHKTFVVELFDPVGAALGDGLATGTILDEEGPLPLADRDVQPLDVGVPGTAGFPRALRAGVPQITVSGANAPTAMPDPVAITESTPGVVVLGAHLVRGVDPVAASNDSLTPTGSNTTQHFSVDVVTDAPVLEFRHRDVGGHYRIWVDGQPTSLEPILDRNGGALYRTTVRFPNRMVRALRFEMDVTRFVDIVVNRDDYVGQAARAGRRAVIIGDSFTEGARATSKLTAYPQTLCYLQGWQDCWVAGSGGTGYLNPGPASLHRSTFRQRVINDVLRWEPDVVVIAGGRNDGPYPVADVQREARLLFEQIRAALPNALLIVTSFFPATAPESRYAKVLALTKALKTSAAGLADVFLDVTGDNAYVTGTGNAGRLQGDGNADVLTAADGVHPTQAGHDRLAWELHQRLLADQEAAAVADTTAPTSPGTPTTSVTGTSVDLAWAPSTDAYGVTSYDVHRSSTAGFTPEAGNKVHTDTGRSTTDSPGLGTWYYVVVARDAAGNASTPSSQATVTVTAPSTPTVVTLSPTADAFGNAGSPTTNYGTDPTLLSRGKPGGAAYLRFSLPTAPAGQALTGAVLKLRTTTDTTSGSTDSHPVRLAADGWTEAGLTWNNMPAITGAVLGTTSGATAVNTAFSTTLAPSGLSGVLGTQQTFGITSTGTDSLYMWSRNFGTVASRPQLVLTFETLSSDTVPPSTPTGVTSSVNGPSVTLSWTASTDDTDVTSYEVYRSEFVGFLPTPATKIATPTGTSYTEAPGLGTWYYRVVAKDAAGNASVASSDMTAAVSDGTPPTKPGTPTATMAGSTVSLTWAGSTDAFGVTGYELHRSATAGLVPTPGTLVTTVMGTSASDSPGLGTWYYLVVAKDAAGNGSPPSDQVSATVSATGTPTVVTVSPSADAFANSGAPTTNYGTNASLLSRGTAGAASYLRFAIPAAPAGKSLTGAVLRLRTTTDPTSGSAASHTVRVTDDGWMEAALTWNHRPAIGGALLGTISGASAVNTQHDTALTPSAVAALLGTTQTFGISSTGSDSLYVWSRNFSTVSARPQLILNFS